MDSIVIIGIDPGLANTGWGIIESCGSRLRPISYGCITTTPDRDLHVRLQTIHDDLITVIERYHPRALSAEGIYFGANSKSAIATAQARGAALVACAATGLECGEYTPMQIKQAVVGTGSADKTQVIYMVRKLLGLDHDPKPDHAADALAAAICHAHLRGLRTLERRVADETGQDIACMAGQQEKGSIR